MFKLTSSNHEPIKNLPTFLHKNVKIKLYSFQKLLKNGLVLV